MNLNHLGLISSDAKATCDFLTKYFGLRNIGGGNNPFVLEDDRTMIISIFHKAQVSYPEGFHLGFYQESNEQVTSINAQLKQDGFEVSTPSHLHGCWTFNVKAPGGLTIEVLHWLGNS